MSEMEGRGWCQVSGEWGGDGPVGCYMYSSKRIGALVVGHWRADQVWKRGSTWVGNGTAVGQWAHHDHGNNIVVVVLHAHGMRLRARTVCL